MESLPIIPNASQGLDAHYLGFFEHFNQGRFFEAHEVLEVIWLPQRQRADGRFYQGLIQLAAAFLHWQKNRRSPAKALFRLARTNLSHYPDTHLQLHTQALLLRIERWIEQLENGGAGAGTHLIPPLPVLSLEKAV